MVDPLPSIIRFSKRHRKTAALCGVSALFVLSLGVSAIADWFGEDDIGRDTAYAAVHPQEIDAASGLSLMSLNEFLLATRATRFLPPTRTWWHRKGDKPAAAFGAIAPSGEEPTDAVPGEIAPVAFSALSPGGLGDGDLGEPGNIGPSGGPNVIPSPNPASPGPTGPIGPGTKPASPPPTSPIPEPSSWMMMILGMGGIAAMMRRRHQTRPA